MSQDLSQARDKDKERQRISALAKKIKIEKAINEQEYAYLQTLIQKFDPKMFD